MPTTASLSASVPGAAHRPNVHPLGWSLKMVRPSLLDVRFRGDTWIVDRGDGAFALCLGDFRLASIRGLALDLPHLNRLLSAARHRRPRWRV